MLRLLPRLCALAAISGCRVYNAELVEDHRFVHYETAGTTADAAATSDGVQSSGESVDKLPACGNGRVDDTERCDIAIPRGQPGACPEACSGRDGCFRQRLAGQRCAARCEEVAIQDAADGDGCCPEGASAKSDDDCSATCGNGMVEHTETCDPPATCPQSEACVSSDPCMVARYSGSPSLCSANCELHAIDTCTSDDGCCPAGCGAAQDSDCTPLGGGSSSGAGGSTSTRAPQTTPRLDGGTCIGESCPPKPDAGSDSGTMTSGGSDADPTGCLAVHSGDRCETCDCTYCADGVTSCLSGSKADESAACKVVIDCAATNHCRAIDCLCGGVSLNQCEIYPRGPCRDEMLALAGTVDPISAVLAATNADSGIGHAANVISCRTQHCSSVCGL